MDKYIKMNSIKGFFGEYRFLSNFYLSEVEFEGMKYRSSEAAYQAAKTLDLSIRDKFRTLSPKLSKELGKKMQLSEDWESVKDDTMYRIVYEKFASNKYLKDKLLETKDLYLEETNNWGDTYWGVCDGVGSNKLGHTLMRVRLELTNKYLKYKGL